MTINLECLQKLLFHRFVKINFTLGPAYNEEKDAKETARYKWVHVVTKLFNMAVNDFDAKESARYSRVLAVTELVLSGTQCTIPNMRR